MKKGIIIYAFGHENYYRMAEVLAASLIENKAGADISIGIICDNPARITHGQLFTDIITLPQEKFMVNGRIVFNHATVLMYDLTPYDITIKLDADMVWIPGRSVAKLFDQLQDLDITFENNGFSLLKEADRKRSVWAPAANIQKAYGFTGEEKMYTIFGEFVYFRKCGRTKKFFDKVKSVYHKPKVECARFSNGTFTDELAFQIVSMMQEIYPHQDNFAPVFNQFLHFKEHNRKYPYQLPDNFYAYSIGGNALASWVKDQYNILAAHYFSKLKLLNPFKAKDKRTFLPERQKL